MFWLWFTLTLLLISAVDSYFTRRRLARQGAVPPARAASPPAES